MKRSSIGSTVTMKGYVTTFDSVADRSSSELERALGFHPGSLDHGHALYELCEPIGVRDFAWKDRTTYSAGWHYDASIDEYVQRSDELRAHLGKTNAYAEPVVDAIIRRLMERQSQRLNVRSGPGRIVKVVPAGRVEHFPDSPLRRVPQWELVVPKRFTRL